MKRLLHSLAAASVVAGFVLTVNDLVNASAQQALAPAQNAPGDKPGVLPEKAAPNDAKGSKVTKVNVDSQGVILKGYDPVAYFKQRKSVKGNPAIETTYQGATYLFASAANKAEFEKDPAKYVPSYGGFCAYGIANGVMADVDGPEAFTVYNGKLYICGNQAALKGFKTDIDANIDKADLNWLRLNGL
ncbi:MAG: YHS domain-containing protein [Verrucomicrobia bacterium]|nr:YHS domain-containing protein [Verrucomicrobiota bacterium]